LIRIFFPEILRIKRFNIFALTPPHSRGDIADVQRFRDMVNEENEDTYTHQRQAHRSQ